MPGSALTGEFIDGATSTVLRSGSTAAFVFITGTEHPGQANNPPKTLNATAKQQKSRRYLAGMYFFAPFARNTFAIVAESCVRRKL